MILTFRFEFDCKFNDENNNSRSDISIIIIIIIIIIIEKKTATLKYLIIRSERRIEMKI